MFDQLELHPYNPQLRLLEYLKSHNIIPQAYSPLGSSNTPLAADADIMSIAEQHKLKPVDVLLGYHSDYRPRVIHVVCSFFHRF